MCYQISKPNPWTSTCWAGMERCMKASCQLPPMCIATRLVLYSRLHMSTQAPLCSSPATPWGVRPVQGRGRGGCTPRAAGMLLQMTFFYGKKFNPIAPLQTVENIQPCEMCFNMPM